ncbi:LysE family translocator [Thalassotalea ganghwensis]
MGFTEGFLLITTVHLLAAASPGPDFILVSQQTLTHGRKTGLLASFGIALGLSIHIAYSIFGLAAIIANSETALWVIKLLGGSYLLFLGYQGLRAKPNTVDINKVKQTMPSPFKSVSSGFLCNALNPKAPVYFVALFTIVLSPDIPTYHLLIYGVWMMILQFLWFSTVVFLLSRPSINKRFQALGHWLNRLFGIAMISMGIKVFMTKFN